MIGLQRLTKAEEGAAIIKDRLATVDRLLTRSRLSTSAPASTSP